MPSLVAWHDRIGQAACQLYSGLAQESCGELDGALECCARAEEAFAEIGVYGNASDTRARVARCSLATGQLETAQRHARVVWNCLRLDWRFS